MSDKSRAFSTRDQSNVNKDFTSQGGISIWRETNVDHFTEVSSWREGENALSEASKRKKKLSITQLPHKGLV